MKKCSNVSQVDIFGKRHNNYTKPTEPIKKSSTKFYPKISLSSGINEAEVKNDFVLIHRMLQRKLSADLQNNISKLVQIVYNEMAIKSGKIDAVNATRNSLMQCFIPKNMG